MNPPLAEITFLPAGLLVWVLVGLGTGWWADAARPGRHLVMLRNLVAGLTGGLAGGLALSGFVEGALGLGTSLLAAFLGACLFIALVWAAESVRVR